MDKKSHETKFNYPWKIDHQGIHGNDIEDCNGDIIATVYDESYDWEVSHLIKAAPELLETLKVVLDHISQTQTDFEYNGIIIPRTDVIKYITLALKKAEGNEGL